MIALLPDGVLTFSIYPAANCRLPGRGAWTTCSPSRR